MEEEELSEMTLRGWMGGTCVDWDEDGRELYFLLKVITQGEANQIVRQVEEGNSWEATRELWQHYQRNMIVDQSVCEAALVELVNKKRHKPEGTFKVMIELECRARECEERTGNVVENTTKMSIMYNVMDPEVRRAVNYEQCKDWFEVKRAIKQCANLFRERTRTKDSMDLGSVGVKENEEQEARSKIEEGMHEENAQWWTE